MKLLIKFPTRGRVVRFFEVLDKYYSLLDDLSNTEFCITIDYDDPIMNDDDVLDKLETYENLYYYVGDSKSKIEAINNDMSEFVDFDILMLASDDMVPQQKGYDTIIRENMKSHYPDTDGILWFYDGNRKDLNTLCILGKKYYDRFNYIYHPDYKSFFCDNEFTIIGNHLGKQKYIHELIIRHEHPDIPQFRHTCDELYIKNSKYFKYDQELFNKRLKNNFYL